MRGKLTKSVTAVSLALVMLLTGVVVMAAPMKLESGWTNTYSITADGEIRPYTYYLLGVNTNAWEAGNDTVAYDLTIDCAQPVWRGSCNVTVRRSVNGDWVDAAPGRYYEGYNSYTFSFADTVSGLPSGRYRVFVDYWASDGSITDYFYDESGDVYL